MIWNDYSQNVMHNHEHYLIVCIPLYDHIVVQHSHKMTDNHRRSSDIDMRSCSQVLDILTNTLVNTSSNICVAFRKQKTSNYIKSQSYCNFVNNFVLATDKHEKIFFKLKIIKYSIISIKLQIILSSFECFIMIVLSGKNKNKNEFMNYSQY